MSSVWLTAWLLASLSPVTSTGASLLTGFHVRVQNPAAEPNWSLSIRRSQVKHALESSLSILAGVEDAWLAWRQVSAQTEARLKHLLASSRPHYGLHDQVCQHAVVVSCIWLAHMRCGNT